MPGYSRATNSRSLIWCKRRDVNPHTLRYRNRVGCHTSLPCATRARVRRSQPASGTLAAAGGIEPAGRGGGSSKKKVAP
ncbi:MAG: hypothetical protein K0R38_7111 [Polyangiaceae bacterium]|nr:hypothetical protein [Polyangiaceae bacterium]